MKKVFRALMRPLFGLLCCVAAALLTSHIAEDYKWRGFVPILFIAVIVFLSSRYGMTVSVLGSIASAMIFAWFLLPPLGNFRVSDPVERGNLAWMLLGGVTIPFLILPPPRGVNSDENQPRQADMQSHNER